MKTIYVNYIPSLDSELWTCIPGNQTPSSQLEVNEGDFINGVKFSDIRGINLDFINDDAYGAQGTDGPPELVEFLDMGKATDVLDQLKLVGYHVPTVNEVCAQFGSTPGQYEAGEDR